MGKLELSRDEDRRVLAGPALCFLLPTWAVSHMLSPALRAPEHGSVVAGTDQTLQSTSSLFTSLGRLYRQRVSIAAIAINNVSTSLRLYEPACRWPILTSRACRHGRQLATDEPARRQPIPASLTSLRGCVTSRPTAQTLTSLRHRKEARRRPSTRQLAESTHEAARHGRRSPRTMPTRATQYLKSSTMYEATRARDSVEARRSHGRVFEDPLEDLSAQYTSSDASLGILIPGG